MDQETEKTRAYSLSFWLKLLLSAILAAFVLFLLIFIVLNTRNLTQQEIENRETILSNQIDSVNQNLEALEQYLYQLLDNSEEIVRLETGGDEAKEFMARQTLAREMSRILTWNSSLVLLFYYAPGNVDRPFIRVTSGSGVYEESLKLQEQVTGYIDRRLAEGQVPGRDYLLLREEDQGYVIRFYKIRNSYIGMCLNGNTILEPLKQEIGEGESIAFLSDPEGNIISSTADFGDQVELSEDHQFVQKEGERYLQLSLLSQQGDFRIGTWTQSRAISRQFQHGSVLLLAFGAVSILMVLGLTMVMQRFLYRPIKRMERGMKQVRKGEWDLAVKENTRILEYDNMIENFNRMVSEIRNLKIDNYEKEISAQKIYLQYLQLQVNPHFYLNALNIIYSMAQVGNTELIQEMTMSLVEYSRYMFREPRSLVTVQQEMEHVENYMKIQRLRFPDRIDFRPFMSSEIEEALIPPFIIQSFVENSIKYAVSFEQRNILMIQGMIEEIGEEPFVAIEIRDNGTGYSQEILELINAKEDSGPDTGGTRVGIRNVKQRLQLVFGDRAKLMISNEDGAVTRILIPLLWQEDTIDEE